MSTTGSTRPQLGRRWVRRLGLALGTLLLLAVGLGGWMLYRGVAVSGQAERNLHATLFAIRLVEQFIAESGRWPRSWEELESLDAPDGLPGHDWPAISPDLQRRVFIDFSADPRDVARQKPMEFSAIKPIGPYYEYRDYGHVESLQATIRKSVGGAADP